MFRFLFAILLCLSFLSGCASQEFIDHKPKTPAVVRHIKWKPYSEVSFIVSKSTKKAVMIYFSDKDEPACQLMERSTLKDPEVAYFINENFVPISVHGAQDKYNITKFPTILILSSADRAEIMRLDMAMESEELLNYLRLAERINSLTAAISVMEALNLGGFGIGSP